MPASRTTGTHDQITWCAVAVLQASSTKNSFDPQLNVIGEHDNLLSPAEGQRTAQDERPCRLCAR
jgi:hypothetical protein